MMQRIWQFIRVNRALASIAAAVLVVAAVVSQMVIGLNAGVGAALIVFVLVVSLGVYLLLNRAAPVWDEPLSPGGFLFSGLIALIAVGLVIQLVPFGWDRSNPPVTAEPAWDSVRTRELTVRACFDCHSNEVDYPWYSRVAPISWAVQMHVEEGREKLNFSEWDRSQREAEEASETVTNGEMPPGYYTLLAHSDARLSDAELQELIDGLEATIGIGDGRGGERND